MRVVNRMRVHLPMLLALSANSPFWQGRDTGLASARTPLFQAFPRVGIPRPFVDYSEWADIVDLLIRTDTMPDATYIWWDVRPQPRFGTIEVRIMDAQSSLDRVGPLVALVQSLARLEATEGFARGRGDPRAGDPRREPLPGDARRRARAASSIRSPSGASRSASGSRRCSRRARRMRGSSAAPPSSRGCADIAADGADARQRRLADERGGLGGLVEALAEEFVAAPAATGHS